MGRLQKKNKGITLVALVITIIILLILAGITISQLTGSGLFENAKLAEQKSKNAEEKQDEILGDYENTLEGYINNNRETVTIDKEEYENLKSRVTALETTEDITSAMTLNEEYVTKRSTVQLTKNGNTIVLTAYLNVVGDISGTASSPATIITIDSQYVPKKPIVELSLASGTIKLVNIHSSGSIHYTTSIASGSILAINATWQI